MAQSIKMSCKRGSRMRLWALVHLLLLLVLPLVVLGDPSQYGQVQAPPPPPPPRQTASITNNNPSTIITTEVIQVVETEVWDGERWIGVAAGRWTTLDGHASVSPADIEAPPNGTFEGDWKIVLGGERDNYGWSYIYYYMSSQSPRRQRIWLRTVQLTASAAVTPKKPSTTARTFQTLQSQSAKLRMRLPSLTTISQSQALQSVRTIPSKTQQLPALVQSALQLIKDDWNFKGFGFSFYKSFIFKKSFGLAFRIPLTINFGLWDSHPEWPSLSMSFAFFYPFTAMVSIAGSVNVEWIKWCVVHAAIITRHTIALVLLSLARGLVLAGSAMAFPITRQLYEMPDSKSLLPSLDSSYRDKPIFSTTLQERVGVSYSWRVSAKRGYEFRRTLWHLYLPTLLSLLQQADRIQQTCHRVYLKKVKPNTLSSTRYLAGFVPLAVRQRKRRKQQSQTTSSKATTVSLLDYARNAKWSEWCTRKTGSLGVSTGGPIPDKPHFSCSSVLSLSGFYFQPNTIFNNGGSTTTTAATTTTTASLPEVEEREDIVEAAIKATKTTTIGSTNSTEEVAVAPRLHQSS